MRGSAPSVPRRAEAAARRARSPGSSSTSRQRRVRHGDDDELGDPHSRLDDERLARVGVEEDHAQLAAVAGVDEAGRVHDRDPVLRRQAERGMTSPAWPSGIATAMPVPTSARSPGPSSCRSHDDEIEPGVARVGARRQDGVVAQARDRQLDHAGRRRSASDARRRGTARSGATRARGSRARMSTPSSRSSRSSIGGAERVQLGELRALLVRHEQLDQLEPLGEALGDPRPQLVEPLPGERRDLQRARESGSRAAGGRASRPRRPCSGRARPAARSPRSRRARR